MGLNPPSSLIFEMTSVSLVYNSSLLSLVPLMPATMKGALKIQLMKNPGVQKIEGKQQQQKKICILDPFL